LSLVDGGFREEEVEVAGAEAAQHAGREVAAVFGERHAEDVEAIETVADGATEGGVLAGGGEEVLVVVDERAGPLAPTLGTRAAGGVAGAVEARPHQAVEMESVGVVVVVGLIDAVLEPAAAAVHEFEAVEEFLDDGAVGAAGVAVGPEELEDVDAHEVVVVVDDAVAAGGAEPAGDLVFFGGA
jgi:hypothetical protein